MTSASLVREVITFLHLCNNSASVLLPVHDPIDFIRCFCFSRRVSDVEVLHFEGMLIDEVSSFFDVVTH